MRCNGMSRPIFLNCLAKRTIEYKGHSMHLSFAVQWCIASDCAATSLRARAFTHTHNAKNSNETQKTCKKTCGSERAWNHAPAMKYRQGGQRHALAQEETELSMVWGIVCQMTVGRHKDRECWHRQTRESESTCTCKEGWGWARARGRESERARARDKGEL
jgi:hypothetical protein